MKALRLTRMRSLSLEEVPAALPEKDETSLKVLACALCRTDAKMWDKGQRDLMLPRILGHEIYGISESTGERYVVWPGESCDHCRECEDGAENLCGSMRILGFNKDGGLAEKVVAKQASLIPVPDDLSGPVATLAEPLGCCLNALNQVTLERDARVLIFGAGPVGLLMALAAKVRGTVPLLVDINPAKVSASCSFQDRIDVAAQTMPIDGEFDVAINATSSIQTLRAAMDRLRPGGQFCFFSGFSASDPVPVEHINEIHYRQLRIAGAYGCTRANMENALRILSAYRDTARLLIEEVIPLDRVHEHMERIAAGQAMKVVVNMGGEP